MDIHAIDIVLAPPQAVGEVCLYVFTSLRLPVVNFVATQEGPLPGHLALACGFVRYQGGSQIEQAQPWAIATLEEVWVMNLTPQQLQSTTDTEHWYTALHSPADFGSESALAHVTQAGDGIFTAWQQDGVVGVEAFTAVDRHHGHSWFMDQLVKLVKIAGVRVNHQRQVDLLRLEVSTVMQGVFFRQGMAHHGEEGNRGNASALV